MSEQVRESARRNADEFRTALDRLADETPVPMAPTCRCGDDPIGHVHTRELPRHRREAVAAEHETEV